jgi:hypothetical protein
MNSEFILRLLRPQETGTQSLRMTEYPWSRQVTRHCERPKVFQRAGVEGGHPERPTMLQRAGVEGGTLSDLHRFNMWESKGARRSQLSTSFDSVAEIAPSLRMTG